jgi:sulfate adenylyltransferase
MDTPFRVLFVCTANISRSAFAEAYARSVVDRDGRSLAFASAGTWGLDGHPMDPPMVHQLVERGITPDPGFRSRKIDGDDIGAADLVLTMEATHRAFLLDDHPAAVNRVFVLGQFAGQAAARAPQRGAQLLAELTKRRHASRETDDVVDAYRRGDAATAAAAQRISVLVDAALDGLA